jgi:ABC-type transporter Mla maintaining outer membrane lipid asymmetry permease subunit MlaE
MGFDMKLFIKECYLKFVPSVLITLLSGFAINVIITQSGWFWLGVKGTVIVAVFGVSFFFTSISRQARNSLLKKIRG